LTRSREPSIGTVLFDLDGTLIDSTDLILASYRRTMRTHLGSVPPDDVWLATMGCPLAVQLRDFARDEVELQAMLETYSAHNEAHHEFLVRPFPTMRPVLERLRDEAISLGIVTSKRSRATHRGLRHCGIEAAWFEVVVTSDDVTRYKPDPAPVLTALQALGEDAPARALFVGDSTHDMDAGRAAGVRTAAALWGPFTREQLEPKRPDYWVPTPESLPPILGLA
jgi:pyrophosphatase PpaX